MQFNFQKLKINIRIKHILELNDKKWYIQNFIQIKIYYLAILINIIEMFEFTINFQHNWTMEKGSKPLTLFDLQYAQET